METWHLEFVYPYKNVTLESILEEAAACIYTLEESVKVKVIPGWLRPRIFVTFGTTRVVGRQPYAPAAFTPGEIPGTHFQRLSRPQGTWFRQGEP